jgi:hypothetical protein
MMEAQKFKNRICIDYIETSTVGNTERYFAVYVYVYIMFVSVR